MKQSFQFRGLKNLFFAWRKPYALHIHFRTNYDADEINEWYNGFIEVEMNLINK